MRSIGADVAESLHDDSSAFTIDAQLAAGLVAHHHHTAAGGFAASARSADIDRLAGHDGGHGLAHVHGVGVHHPGHDLFVGVDVGGGDILLRANEFDELRGIAARHTLDFAHRHFVRVADHAALGAAEGDVDHGALPGHPTGERAHFIERDVGCVADPSLGRAARDGMLHAKASKDFEMAVVHLDGNVHDNLAVGIAQNPPQALIEVEFLSSQVEAGALRLPRVGLFIHVRGGGDRCHKNILRNDGRSMLGRRRTIPGRGRANAPSI